MMYLPNARLVLIEREFIQTFERFLALYADFHALRQLYEVDKSNNRLRRIQPRKRDAETGK